MNYQKLGDLDIAEDLYSFIATDVIPGSGVETNTFWSSLEEIIRDLQTKNADLLAKRDQLQKQIDEWHQSNRDQKHDAEAYKKFLQDIGYLVDEPDDFQITTTNIDAEIAKIAGPQLVVPLDNARYVLNAVNARWGSQQILFQKPTAVKRLKNTIRFEVNESSSVRATLWIDILLWNGTHTNM